MPRLQGKQLKDENVQKQLTHNDKKEIAIAFGENLAEMQKLVWNFPGQYELGTNTIKPFNIPFDEWVLEQIDSLLEKASLYGDRTTTEDRAWVKMLTDKGQHALQEPFTPVFVMHDYQNSNMVVDKVDGKWKVTGLFDLMENYFGDGEADVSRMFAGYAKDNIDIAYIFLNSYLSKIKTRRGFVERFTIYMLMDRLVIWEFANRCKKNWWDPNLTLKEWCQDLVFLDNNRLKLP